MFSLNDPWPDYLTGPTKQLHALGVISLNFNLFEAMWADLLAHYAGEPTAKFLLQGRVTDERRISSVRYYAALKETSPDIIDRIEHVISAYIVCATNRNHLMHSHQFFSRSKMDKLSLRKKSNSGQLLKFHFDLPELRRVADDIMEGYTYLGDLTLYLECLADGSVLPALPDKSLSPHALDPSEILEGQ